MAKLMELLRSVRYRTTTSANHCAVVGTNLDKEGHSFIRTFLHRFVLIGPFLIAFNHVSQSRIYSFMQSCFKESYTLMAVRWNLAPSTPPPPWKPIQNVLVQIQLPCLSLTLRPVCRTKGPVTEELYYVKTQRSMESLDMLKLWHVVPLAMLFETIVILPSLVKPPNRHLKSSS